VHQTWDICWWNGPYKPRTWNDEMIFKDTLLSMLEYGERCETDGGYQGSAPDFVKCPKGVWGESGKWAMQQKVRSRQETVNERLKNWAILTTPYCHNLKLHQTVFAAVILLLQLSFEYNPLFSVEYNDSTLTVIRVKTLLNTEIPCKSYKKVYSLALLPMCIY